MAQKLLREGSRGEDVRRLQTQLKSAGFDVGAIDAIFGPKTKAAVGAFQKAKGLDVDYLVGPKTWGALTPSTTYTGKKPYQTSEYAGKRGTWMKPGKPKEGYSGLWKEGYVPYTATEVKVEEKPTVPTKLTLEEAKSIIGRELTADEISGIQRGVLTRETLLERKKGRIGRELATTQATVARAKELGYTSGEEIKYSEETGKMLSAEEARNQQTDQVNQTVQDIFDNIPGDDVDMRDSTKILEDIQKKLEEAGEKIPKPVSLVDLYKEQKKKLGIEPLEDELADIDAQIERIQGELFVQAEEAGEKLISTREIGRAKGALQKRADREIALLNIERSAVARILGNKIDTLNTIVSLTDKDYDSASDYYTKEYNRTIQLYNLASGIEAKEQTTADRAKQDAKANLDILTNALQGAGKSYADLTPDQQLKIKQLEAQAGLPTGVTELVLNSVDTKKEISFHKYSDDGTQVSVHYKDGTTDVFDTGLAAKVAKPTTEEKKVADEDWMNETMRMSKEAGTWEDTTYEEAYNEIRGARPDISESIVKDWLERQGKRPKEKIEKEEKRTWPDTKIKDRIESSYKEGYTREDIITTFEGTNMSEADKKRAEELVKEVISDELDKWLKKAQDEPDKYKVNDKGIREVKKWLPDQYRYKFK